MSQLTYRTSCPSLGSAFLGPCHRKQVKIFLASVEWQFWPRLAGVCWSWSLEKLYGFIEYLGSALALGAGSGQVQAHWLCASSANLTCPETQVCEGLCRGGVGDGTKCHRGLFVTEDREGKCPAFPTPSPDYRLPPASSLPPVGFSYVKSPAAVGSWSPRTQLFRSPARDGNSILSSCFLGWAMRNCTALGFFSQSVSTRCALSSVTPLLPRGRGYLMLSFQNSKVLD